MHGFDLHHISNHHWVHRPRSSFHFLRIATEGLHLVLEEVIELSNIMECIDLVVGLARVGGGVKLGACAFPIHRSTRGRYE